MVSVPPPEKPWTPDPAAAAALLTLPAEGKGTVRKSQKGLLDLRSMIADWF